MLYPLSYEGGGYRGLAENLVTARLWLSLRESSDAPSMGAMEDASLQRQRRIRRYAASDTLSADDDLIIPLG